jgi:hypothetical protein
VRASRRARAHQLRQNHGKSRVSHVKRLYYTINALVYEYLWEYVTNIIGYTLSLLVTPGNAGLSKGPARGV